MRVHVLQHVPFEDIGSMTSWCNERRARITYTRFFDDPALPAQSAFDLLVIMGGPMSVNDEDMLPWLRQEKAFIRDAVSAGTPVLGVCLGAQLLASAMGARVYVHTHKEIGWFPVERESVSGCGFEFPQRAQVFHWHGETFDLPAGARRLARSRACENQAFQLGRRVIGLQFHLEVTSQGIDALIQNCGSELESGPSIQTARQLRSAARADYARINLLMHDVLSYITSNQ